MRWVKKWTDGYIQAEWVIEGDLVAASVTLTDTGFSAWWPTGHREYPVGTAVERILTEVRLEIIKGLEKALAEVRKLPGVPVAVEPCPVEVCPKNVPWLGYSDGWLRVRPDRDKPSDCSDTIKLDDGRTAHYHPFIRASDEQAAGLGVGLGCWVAGVRWFEPAPK